MAKKEEFLIPVMNNKQRLVFLSLIGVWLAATVFFFVWWFSGLHKTTLWGLGITSAVLFWELLLPAYFFFFVGRMRRTNPSLALPESRIAMVVTKAPSEPFAIVKKTLLACLIQEVPHDTWLADEGPTPEVFEWCSKQGIRVSTRKGIPNYHNESWPRRTKCKEGNLAYFYDTYGYAQYDVVVQLDADHVPADGYLAAMVRPFNDPGVGYVSAPSICDANAAGSWAARGRLFAESIMHGPLQAGLTNKFYPLCIGSHYAIRTAALKTIGGLGPELAEDHSTTLLFASHGFTGVHALDAIAHGDGPSTFGDAMVQEFQWSRSLAVLFLTLTPRLITKLPVRGKIEFLFAQLWYPLYALTMAVGLSIPVLALSLGESLVNVSYVAYFLYSLPLHVLVLCIILFLKKGGWLRPHSAPVISWEAMLFHVARWPWVLYGTLAAIYLVVSKKNITFKVTPKGGAQRTALEAKFIAPYVLIVLVYVLMLIFLPPRAAVSGYYFFASLGTVTYVIVLFALTFLHKKEAKASVRK